MKALHLVKTSDGARWAVEMVQRLVSYGHEIGVILPSQEGKMMKSWESSGAKLFFANVEIPVKNPLEYKKRKTNFLHIVEEFNPDLIHSHFFSTTILARYALGKGPIPVAFQVAGPLHLENSFFKKWDISSARAHDFWIASSQAIRSLYLNSGVAENRVGLSYYGNSLKDYQSGGENLRKQLSFSSEDYVVGSLSYFYPPKAYLGQFKGLKGHELVFEALKAFENDSSLKSVFWGEQWGRGNSYENKLRKLAPKNCQLPGPLSPFDVSKGWNTLDLCVHMPLSENCGGVLEPLLHGVPVIAADIGGLGEVIINNNTGLLIKREPSELQDAIHYARQHQDEMKEYTQRGAQLIKKVFDVDRTSKEISKIYDNLKPNQEIFIPKDHLAKD